MIYILFQNILVCTDFTCSIQIPTKVSRKAYTLYFWKKKQLFLNVIPDVVNRVKIRV